MLYNLWFSKALAGTAVIAALGGCASSGTLLGAEAPASIGHHEFAEPANPDAVIEARIAAILSGMTLRQKIGQMTQADIRSITPDQVREHYIGSILNGGGAWPDGNIHASVEDWVSLARAYHDASMTTDMAINVPIILGTDAVHGHNNVFGATLFPHNIGLGAAHDPDLVGRIAQQTARQVRATGIRWVFAPTLAVVQNPRWGRTYEGYSSDPELVREYAAHFVGGMQGDLSGSGSTIATAKHFIGDGGTWLGVDQGETRATREELFRTHAPGYVGALEAGVQTVMVSYSGWTNTGTSEAHGKMHGNGELITDVLKGELGFDGFVVSDWNAIEQVEGCTRTHCPPAINAGIDMFMVPDDWQRFIEETIADVEAGTVPMSRIDDAVTRILRVKLRSGLFDEPQVLPVLEPTELASEEIRRTAREAVASSLVLLRNTERSPLPLAADSRILLVGRAADNVPAQLGGWSLTWQGDETDDGDYPLADDLLSALRTALTGTGHVDFSEDGSGVDVSAYDVVIVVLAEDPYAEMRGDIPYPATLRHSARFPQDLAALERVSGKGVPVVSVLYSGRPVYVNDLLNLSDAFIAAWLPGTEGMGITDVLLRPADGSRGREFTGRLPYSWPGDPCPETTASPALFDREFGLRADQRSELGSLPVDNRLTCPPLAQ